MTNRQCVIEIRQKPQSEHLERITSRDVEILLNGEDISKDVRAVNLSIHAQDVVKATIEFYPTSIRVDSRVIPDFIELIREESEDEQQEAA